MLFGLCVLWAVAHSSGDNQSRQPQMVIGWVQVMADGVGAEDFINSVVPAFGFFLRDGTK